VTGRRVRRFAGASRDGVEGTDRRLAVPEPGSVRATVAPAGPATAGPGADRSVPDRPAAATDAAPPLEVRP
jgi:hypothetical protein